MLIHTLPDAIQREREALLRDSVDILKIQGNQEVEAHDLPGYREPDELMIPVLNVPMQPDIMASHPQHTGPTIGVVEVSTDLGEESCGRRWQAFALWAKNHDGHLHIFVHPEDHQRTTEIAQYWHVDPGIIVPVARAH